MEPGRVLITEEEIRGRVSQLARKVSSDYRGRSATFVGILKGAFVFLSDLVREVDFSVEVDFLGLSSYRGTARGESRFTRELSTDLGGKDVLLVEGIVDTGLTLSGILDSLKGRRPASIKVCALLDKTQRRKVEVKLDYVGFEIPDLFVVGYGLDFEEDYRNLPHIAVFEPRESSER